MVKKFVCSINGIMIVVKKFVESFHLDLGLFYILMRTMFYSYVQETKDDLRHSLYISRRLYINLITEVVFCLSLFLQTYQNN